MSSSVVYFLINSKSIIYIKTKNTKRPQSALVSKKLEKLKTNILLEIMNDIINEYPDTRDFIQQKLIEKCNREGISINKVFFLFASLEAKHFYKAKHVIYQSQHMLLAHSVTF